MNFGYFLSKVHKGYFLLLQKVNKKSIRSQYQLVREVKKKLTKVNKKLVSNTQQVKKGL